jgi:hypothetical protein
LVEQMTGRQQDLIVGRMTLLWRDMANVALAVFGVVLAHEITTQRRPGDALETTVPQENRLQRGALMEFAGEFGRHRGEPQPQTVLVAIRSGPPGTSQQSSATKKRTPR